ncbi:L-alanine exporter AlaE [Acinetobacter sp. V91_7]|uniref:L-alanine exporter AlaE n=1 Tax=Acinetobacter TaxID=469 RepID=UPI0018DFE8F4|nr:MULTISPECIES: L-alanine exporter AlaE [unclassified Acinetobacter]MBI0423111.1 L-alanine exporter AlaE [Acinetobacter sp. ACIN00229]MDS7932809.1 L-alanine exporter AlaE [Acinetobacter sp. V91_4B]MDS7963806.1 L-alanine exporter AlaE [Acinetobacter sp. V91_7]MDS8028487.1 L-alanine exporter AlaE [Acinetobacter sp. V91_13]
MLVGRENLKKFFADTFAMVLFSLAIGTFVELVITGLTLEQTFKIRATAIPISLVIGRPYGFYRDWIFKKIWGKHKTAVQSFLLDTLANLTFQIPLYILILAFNGATLVQVVTAVSSILIIVSVSGRPYGIFLNFCRKLFGVFT